MDQSFQGIAAAPEAPRILGGHLGSPSTCVRRKLDHTRGIGWSHRASAPRSRHHVLADVAPAGLASQVNQGPRGILERFRISGHFDGTDPKER